MAKVAPQFEPLYSRKAFETFLKSFELRHEAAYPEPSKVLMEGALEHWKIIRNQKPNINKQLFFWEKPNIDEENDYGR